MSKPTHVSRYYADDKDVFDLLLLGVVTPAKLHTFLRGRGIIVSPDLPKIEICRYLQTSPLSWPQLEALLELIERPDREDNFTTCQLATKEVDVQKAAGAAAAVQQERGARCGEVYSINVVPDGALEITVHYSEPNFSKTRCLQHLDRTLVIRLEQEGDHYKVRHHENNRALEILECLEKQLTPPSEEPPPRRDIAVSGLASAQRSKFFIDMARGISGYKLKDERGLQVDRPLASGSDGLGEEDDDAAVPNSREESEKFQGLVRRALLHGTGLLMSQQYQDYAKSGFCITKLIWTVEPEDEEGAIVEFFAAFRAGDRGTGFQYGVNGKFERHDDGSLAKTKRQVVGPEKNKLLALLESSAYAALKTAKAEVPVVEPPEVEAPA